MRFTKTTISPCAVVGLFLSLVLLFPLQSAAEQLIVYNLGGSVSYNYGYSEASGVQSESATLATTLGANGYVWQPWFIDYDISLTLGLNKRKTNTGAVEGASRATSGSLAFSVFPQSRFPFSFGYSRTDSVLESTGSSSSAETRNTSTRYSVSQAYTSRTGVNANVLLFHTQTTDDNDETFENDFVNGRYRIHHKYQSLSVNSTYSENSRSTDDSTPNRTNVSVRHSYLPGTALGVNSMLSYHRSDSGDASSDISKFTQASSNFSWRPDHKPYDMSGNVTVSKNEFSADSPESQRLSTSVGTRYRFSRRLNLLANLSFAVAESGDQQTETTGQNVNLAYNSEQTIIAGFNYGWAASTGLSNSTTEVSGGSGDGGTSGDADSDRDTQSASIGLGHHLSNSWAVGRASSVNMGFSQNVTFSQTNSSEDDAEEGATTLSNGLSSGWSHRGLDGTSFVSLSISDSHRFGDEETDSQLLNFQLTRNQTLSRVSGLSVNAAFQSSRQARENQESTTSKSANAGIGYNNSRAFGVYNLRLQARLQYQPAIDDNTYNRNITRFFSTLYYRIGKLSTNISLIVTQTESQDPAYGLNFSATRTF